MTVRRAGGADQSATPAAAAGDGQEGRRSRPIGHSCSCSWSRSGGPAGQTNRPLLQLQLVTVRRAGGADQSATPAAAAGHGQEGRLGRPIGHSCSCSWSRSGGPAGQTNRPLLQLQLVTVRRAGGADQSATPAAGHGQEGRRGRPFGHSCSCSW